MVSIGAFIIGEHDMPPAIIGGVIAGVGAVGAAAIGSSASKSAAKSNQQAADTASAETRAAREQAYSTLSPYVQTGNAAQSQINALLGLNTQQPQPQMQPQGVGQYQPNDMNGFGGIRDNFAGVMQNMQARQNGQVGQQPMQQGGYVTQPTAESAFDQYRNSTGYQFRLGEGMNALNAGYAGAGTIKSGAAMRAATEYGQNFASGEFGNYLNALGNQQGIGLQAGSASAGVGVNAANSLGTIAMNNGANQANAALVRASALGQGIAGGANALGTILGPQTNYAASMPSAAQINTSTLASLRGY